MKQGKDYTGISVVFYCHDGKGRFVFQKRSNKCRNQHGKWDCGAGGLEFGESPKETLARELKEEYGVTEFEIEQELAPVSVLHEENGETQHWLALCYIVRVNPDHIVIGEPEMIDELDWFRVGEFPEPLHPGIVRDMEDHGHVFEDYRHL